MHKTSQAFKLLSILLVCGLLFVAIPAGQVHAADFCVNSDGSGSCFTSIQSAIDAAASGDTINVAAGTYDVSSTILINKALTITGPGGGGAIVQGANSSFVSIFEISASNVTISNLTITHNSLPVFGSTPWSELPNSLIRIPDSLGLSGITISQNTLFVPAQSGSLTTWGGVALTVGRSQSNGINISNNTIYNTRNGIVIYYNNSVTISNNVIYNTKGGVMNYTGSMEDSNNRVITNNSWGTTHNEWDIVWNSGGGPYQPDYNQQVLQRSQANNDAYVLSLMNSPSDTINIQGNRSHVFVNALTGTTTKKGANGNINLPYAKIQDGINGVVPGGKVIVAGGTYPENVNINKPVDLGGAGQANTIVIPAISSPLCSGASICAGSSNVLLVQANDVKIHDLTVNGDNPGLTSSMVRGGADVDARNGIITDHTLGLIFNNLEVYNVTVENIYLRGIYASSGGTFNFHNNVVTNVQGDSSSIAIFAWGGPGTIANNTVSYANDAISANHSKGIQFLNNTITNSQSGVHSDNSGDGGGTPDLISGNSVSDCMTNGYGIWTFANYNPITVENNTVSGCSIGYSAWGTATTSIVQFNNNIATGPTVPAGSVGIYVTTDLISYGYYDVYANFNNNQISGFENGVYLAAESQSWNQPWVAKTIHSTFFHNQILGSTGKQAEKGATGFYDADLSINWWGSMGGPAAGKIASGIPYTPWCGDAACSFTLPNSNGVIDLPAGVNSADIQNAIDNAPAGTTIIIPAGTYNFSGGYHIDTPHLTIFLKNGVVIQNTSPCFVMNASFTKITTESIGGATCVPTNGASGIVVASGLENIIIEGLEINGFGQSTDDGIEIAGPITDVQIIDNYIHDMFHSGVAFGDLASGTIDIQGNLIKNNRGVGIYSGTQTLPATYNSWGTYTDPGSVGAATYDPWTHVDVSMTSSGTPWANRVLPGYTITYTVKGNFQNAMGADFKLLYPSSLLSVSSTSMGSYFTIPATTNVLDTTTAGVISFAGYANTTAVSGSDLTLYTVTFTAASTGALGTLDLDAGTDAFAMAPAGGPSNNIYANALSDGAVDVITALPTMSATGLDVSFAQGYAQEFHLIVNNPLAGVGYANPQLQFTLPAGTVLEYFDGSWTTVAGTTLNLTAPLAAGDNRDMLFRATFPAAGSVTVAASLVDTYFTPAAVLATFSQTGIVVNPNVTLLGTFSMQGRVNRAGMPVTISSILYGFLNSTTVDLISNNISFNNVAWATYTITTNQPRYLNVTTDLGKTIAVTGSKTTINPLELKGGNAVYSDNEINVADASKVGTDYGKIGTSFDGDVNFSNKVDIFDLAIVGGNYGLTSTTAYGTWVP
ncbi:MAG: right-handed parallel beta-helix repeat-containing protein [Anaerolineaceae bacterium]